MSLESRHDKEPAVAYATHWGRLALQRLRRFKEEGAETVILNPDAFENLAAQLESQIKKDSQVALAPQVREFGQRIRELIAELDEPIDIEEEVQGALAWSPKDNPDFEREVRESMLNDEKEKRNNKIKTTMEWLLTNLTSLSRQWRKEEAFRVVKKDQDSE